MPVFSLENDREWAALTLKRLREHHLPDVLVEAPLVDYGEFSWYDVQQLPDTCRDISFVVCDGPPGSTPGGRYGLLPLMIGRMKPGCLILVDDTSRPQEAEMVKRWGLEFGVVVSSKSARFSLLQLPGGAQCRADHV